MDVAANLALDAVVNHRLARGDDILHLGFGESRLPVPPELLDRVAMPPPTDYGPVAGRADCLDAVAGYFSRRALPTEGDAVIVAPGSKPIFIAVMAARPGAVVLPAPSWVTYAPQARLLGRRVIRVPVPSGHGGIPDPEILADRLAQADRAGEPVGSLIITNPDNPTGAGAGPDLVRAVVEVASRHGVLVVSDEIYRDVLFDEDADYLSAAQIDHDVVVVTGLSKSLSIGGWRVGAARFADDARGAALRTAVLAVASHVWSNTSAPMQAVAAYAFSEPEPLVAHRRRCTRLHKTVTSQVHRVLTRSGAATAATPVGGFYVYPDLRPVAAGLASVGVHSSADLERYLLDVHAVAVLGGHHFGDDPANLTFRAATSLICGRTAQECTEALSADDPLALPAVSRSIDRLARLVDDLMHLAEKAD